MKRLTCLPLSVLFFALAGCGEEIDELPVDGRDFDGVQYSESEFVYTGRVIDGYLKNARVWLDLDGDGQYSKGPLEVTLANGDTHRLDQGEPTAMTTGGGRFSLDLTEFKVGLSKGKDLDPRDYPLYALALPGKTMEETHSGEVPVPRAYLMSASPGVTNVTPLTTLARFRARVAGQASMDSENAALADSAELNGLNLLQDYIQASNEKAHAYARALAHFMASQIPDDCKNKDLGGGSECVLSREAVDLLGISLVRNAREVFGRVDAQVSGGRYGNVDTDNLKLPKVDVELENPVLLAGLKVYANTDEVRIDALEVSAELAFDYTEDGQLLSVSSQGCMEPSLPEVARLVQVNGYMAQMKNQWHPSASLSAESKQVYADAGIDERIVFDWKNKRAYFDTVTSCHKATRGVSSESSELGGTPEITWSWDNEGEVVEKVSASELPDRKISLLRTASDPAKDLEYSWVTGYKIEGGKAPKAEFAFTSPGSACDPVSSDADAPDLARSHVTQLFPVKIDREVESTYEYDRRNYTVAMAENEGQTQSLSVERLLKYPLRSLTKAGPNAGSLQWQLFYASLDTEGLDSASANLIREAYLKNRDGISECGVQVSDAPGTAYAKVSYNYKTLTEYLLQDLAEN